MGVTPEAARKEPVPVRFFLKLGLVLQRRFKEGCSGVREGRRAAHLANDEVVKEIGSGLNGNRRRLQRLVADHTVGTLVVEHRERLCRFGFEYVEAALAGRGARILVMDEGELEDDLVRDVTEVMTSLCARLYGRRSARRRAERALAAAQEG